MLLLLLLLLIHLLVHRQLRALFGHRLATLLAKRRAKTAERPDVLAKAINRLGPSWVKMGQFLATRPEFAAFCLRFDVILSWRGWRLRHITAAFAPDHDTIGLP